jgi:hypothetical protein
MYVAEDVLGRSCKYGNVLFAAAVVFPNTIIKA